MKTFKHTPDGMVEDPRGEYVLYSDAFDQTGVLRQGLREIAGIVRPLLPVGQRGGALEQINQVVRRSIDAARFLDSENKVAEREGETSG